MKRTCRTGGIFAPTIALLSCLLAASAPGTAGDTRPGSEVPLPDGYRLDRYRAPVPSHVPGAATVSLEEAESLHKAGSVLFIDVMKVPRAASPGVSGKWLVAKPHVAIARSTWLPEVGEGRPDPVVEDYFRRNLDRLTAGDKAAGLLFYCVTDCWMSWNAAKRALSWGYTQVYWFRDGIDVWQQFELPTEIVDPVPLDAG
ncbi:PQQ-dependent catabolism-associated CXXCW motif protein [Skermanella mucosa]|uniref:PQQ-dependent catabolism-associated CXXCW motif protein n=1 Tax=Skermanella mucosa TaxID=1789672 RepID=UPI00192C4B65|nr:PQQ-dependent catabolism-associated CXXCW motif protein [Skermanella mucosa]UEM23362.1 PQQ-dependent catabolism-associated CXXCW motif protein [Skermanella mucosa]